MRKLWELFETFFRIGLFTFGGGYAMIPMIEHECVEKKNWISHDDMIYVTVIAESTPGPVAINCATFVGYRQKGIAGAIAATVGMVLPSFLVIYLISMFLDRFLEYPLVAKAFAGIRVAVGILILGAGINLFRKMKKQPLTLVLFALALAAMLAIDLFAWNFSSIYLMLIAGAVGVLASALLSLGKKNGKGGGDA